MSYQLPAGYTMSAEKGLALWNDWQESLAWFPSRTFDEYVRRRIAPDGHQWRCGACGKTTNDSHGEGGGWDESCMLNSFLEAMP